MPEPASLLARPFASLARHRRWLAMVVAAGALAAGCSGLQTQQRKWIFQATPAPAASAEELAHRAGQHDMEAAWIEHVSTATGKPIRLHALWAENDDPAAPVLLYLHGARRDVSRSAFRIDNMRELGFSVLAIDYRGFGNSTDELPSQDGVVEDALAAWRWLGVRRPDRPRFVFGHSLGGAIAVQLAARLADAPDAGAPRGVILEGTFPSIDALFRTFKWGWLPLTMLISERFDSLEAMPKIKAPVLVVHGSEDSLVPSRLGRALYEGASAPKRFVLVDGGTHYSTNGRGSAQYREALRELFGLGGS